VVQIKPHDFFERDGDHIFCELPLTFTQAALGDEIEVPTVHGKVMLKIPAGTQTGKVFRLRGKGSPNVRGYGHGDQHIQVKIVTPTKVNKKQKELLKEFNELGGNQSTDDQHGSLFKRFKEAFKGEQREIIFATFIFQGSVRKFWDCDCAFTRPTRNICS